MSNGIIAALMSAGILQPYQGRQRNQKQSRPCLQCGKLHRHNNAYCSAECCKTHRGAQQ